jgi:ArsR family transcriptional regulator
VTSKRLSRSIVYAANYGAMDELLRFLTDNCCHGACPPEIPVMRKLPVRRREG